ncbi:MAG TPA: tetratricopeptide repeat protein, partial [Kofleriaceae bacterium]|nr:tetratricopeptide repeat protein [Kofleriaceae bacterium]
AWLAADEPAAALPHGARAHATLDGEVPAALRREVLTTLGEAAWRQRAWPDVIRAYRGLVAEGAGDADLHSLHRYRLAVAADRTGDAELATSALRPFVDDPELGGVDPGVRGPALRLYAELAERAGEIAGAAAALEGFASVEAGAASARADAMYRAGELFRRCDRTDDAVRCLEAALRISDTHLPALDALEQAWRERGDLERVAVILGRKVAATARHPQRQKPLLSRLGDLQEQLGRSDVALATHERALEIDPTWRPSLRFVTARQETSGDRVGVAAGLARLAGELAGDSGLDLAIVARERADAARALAELVGKLDDAQLAVVRDAARIALEVAQNSAAPEADFAVALARLRGEPLPRDSQTEELTPSGRVKNAAAGALSLREQANRARAAGLTADAFAALEAANHVSPGDETTLRELVDLAATLGDHVAGARHLATLAAVRTGSARGDLLLELADIHYDKLEDAPRARQIMREASEAFGAGTRRDATLRLLANEAASHLAWDVATEALTAIDPDRRTGADLVQLATALARAGRPAEAVAALEDVVDDRAGELLAQLRAEIARKAEIARALENRAQAASPDEAGELRDEAGALWGAIGEAQTRGQADPASVLPASPERDRLLAAHHAAPDDAAALAALFDHLGTREPALRREIAERIAEHGRGRVQAMALHELALAARGNGEAIRAASLWTKANEADSTYAPVWMPLADALASADDIALARELYEQIAESHDYDSVERQWAAQRAAALGRDDTVVSGEIRERRRDPSLHPELKHARELAAGEDWPEAIAAAERAAEADPGDRAALELLEQLYLEVADLTKASEALGRQIVVTDDPVARAQLWRRRARLYRDALGRDAEAYRCLKEAHACAPADPEIAYQLRTAAMVRGEWALAASLLYREIATATNPRDRGALHLELALVYEERLDDPAQAQVNYEQALVFDPTIPAARAPLARRYEAIGRYSDAARFYEEAATFARPADRATLLADAARCRASIETQRADAAVLGKLEQAVAAGDVESAVAHAHELWRTDPGHGTAFRVLARQHRAQGDLAALTELVTARAAHTDAGEDRAEAWLEVARLAEELQRPSEAARAYDLALIEDPGHVGALDARGALAFQLGDWAAADLIYRDLAPVESTLGADELALRRSLIAEHLGRDGEALAQAQEAVAQAPGRRELHARVQTLATRLGELGIALVSARTVLDLVPLDDTETVLATQFALVELSRESHDLEAAQAVLERIVRDHPHNARALEQLAEIAIARGDWPAATRYLYQLVPLAPSARERAERLYRLGEAVLVHLGDVDRADDVFLRASDLDPAHLPTLRRLLDVYWRADDPAALVEVAAELATANALDSGPTTGSSLARALVAAALIGETELASRIVTALGGDAPVSIAGALGELAHRAGGRLEVASASTAVAELGRRGLLDLHKVRAAADGTPVAQHLTS